MANAANAHRLLRDMPRLNDSLKADIKTTVIYPGRMGRMFSSPEHFACNNYKYIVRIWNIDTYLANYTKNTYKITYVKQKIINQFEKLCAKYYDRDKLVVLNFENF